MKGENGRLVGRVFVLYDFAEMKCYLIWANEYDSMCVGLISQTIHLLEIGDTTN